MNQNMIIELKPDGRKNNGGNKNAGRKPKNENRVIKSWAYLEQTVAIIEAEAARLGVTRAAVVDAWAKKLSSEK